MKIKLTMRLVLALLFCIPYSFLVAQTDADWLDLGRMKVKKEFTQTVTIKGKDLEQMPFSNLADAIGVWLYGLATNNETVVYVIDGNLITDVNVYSVYDIEEIRLVQNALIRLNGAVNERQLVLITTRKNRDKSTGIKVAGSSFAVTNSYQSLTGDKAKGETNFYHQYYLSAYKNHSRIQYGLSASYLRDVYPNPKDLYDKDDQYQLNRFRFNGYMNAVINTKNSAWVRAGYVPGKVGFEYDNKNTTLNAYDHKNRETYFTVEAGWQSQLFSRLTNELSAGITPVTVRDHTISTRPYAGTTGVIMQEYNSNGKTTMSNLLINDHLAYHAGFGNWHIEPAINFTYRYVKAKFKSGSITTDKNTGTIISASQSAHETKYNVLLLTPAVNIYYKNSFNVQGGFVYNLSKEQPYSAKAEKLLPFVTMTVDVLRTFSPDSKTSWKIYGSYAGGGNFADGAYQLNGVTSFLYYPYPNPNLNPNSSGRMPLKYGGDSSNHMVQAGTSVHLWQDRLQVGYSFEKRKYTDIAFTSNPWMPLPVLTPLDINNNIHRLGITAKIVEGTHVNWLTGLNASVILTEVKLRNGSAIPGSVTKDNPMETGGWVNRFKYKQWMLGLDILYALNLRDYSGHTFGNDNAFSFGNIYAGYQFMLKQTPLDVYAECRNPGQKNENNLPDRRNYFGLGFKATL